MGAKEGFPRQVFPGKAGKVKGSDLDPIFQTCPGPRTGRQLARQGMWAKGQRGKVRQAKAGQAGRQARQGVVTPWGKGVKGRQGMVGRQAGKSAR